MKRLVCKMWLRENCKIFFEKGIILDVTNNRKLKKKVHKLEDGKKKCLTVTQDIDNFICL